MEDMILRTPLGKIIEKTMDDYEKAKPGSEESKVIAGNIEKLYSLYLDDVKTNEYLYRDQQEVEINKQKYIDESRRLDTELELKKKKEETDVKWYKRVSADTIVSCGTVMVLTLAAFQLEKGGNVIPTRMLQMINRIKA